MQTYIPKIRYNGRQMSSEIVWLLFILSFKLNIVARSQQADTASFIQTKINLFWTFPNKKLFSIINSWGIVYLHFFIIRLQTPSTTHTIHSALDALQLLKENEKPIEIFFSRFYFYFNLANSALLRICTLVVLEALK
jgi:hypothetical protein